MYYLSNGKVTAFKPGFRMTVGNPSFRTAAELNAKYKMMDYTCLASSMTRGGATTSFPTQPCKAGIMVSIRFPTCWDGKNLDSPDHQSHVAYPSGSACPATHPVTIPQVFYETYWDTRPFNDKSIWPPDGKAFVWSFGDETGYGIHGDYVFGWKGDALQRAMDSGWQDYRRDRLRQSFSYRHRPNAYPRPELASYNHGCQSPRLQARPDRHIR